MKVKAVLDKFIMSDPTKNDINTNWCTIKSILSNLLNDYVPYRTTKSRHNLPWITNEIKRSMRKRDKLFHYIYALTIIFQQSYDLSSTPKD